ncbi:MAG TPA: hypothetical protein VLG69_01275 [Candidatus Andersenbacteria bacterium]|nr:hypothetical protein [Candidatus Andersenbacteria bacterium]
MTLNHVLEILKGVALPTIGLLIPVAIALIAWFRKDMSNWVHVAVYHVVSDQEGIKSIKIRTIGNVLVTDLMMKNLYATWLVYRAVKKATVDKPILHFPPETAFRIKNLCRGFVSGLFQEGALAQAMCLPVSSQWFVVTLIRDETQRGDRRVGLAIIPRNVIDNMNSFSLKENESWKLESSHHERKIELLRILQNAYVTAHSESSTFLEVELCVIP